MAYWGFSKPALALALVLALAGGMLQSQRVQAETSPVRVRMKEIEDAVVSLAAQAEKLFSSYHKYAPTHRRGCMHRVTFQLN